MKSSHRSPRRSARLDVARLEDRSVPSGLAADASNFASHRVLVTFADGTDTPAHRQELAGLDGTATQDHLGFGIYAITLTSGVSVASATTLYAGQPGVQTVEPDYVVSLERTPNDPSFPTQWGLNNTGRSGGTPQADIGAPAAWTVQTGTGQTIVAEIDTGIDYTHPDLAANIWLNPNPSSANDLHGYNFVTNTGNPMDDNGHGTHVAGIIGAVGNNSIGVTGVLWKTRIMAVKFLDASGSGYTSNAVRAIRYAVAHGATILNNSWGGGGPDATLATAIGQARNAGVIFVAAAGNSGANNDASAFYPADYIGRYDNVVTVAATDRTDTLASFSNYGPTEVTLAAPGVGILSTLPGNSYGTLSGTSMATPFVTGALALLKDRNPTWTYSQLLGKLESSVDVLPSLAGKVRTGGRLDVAKMLGASTVPPSPPAFVSGPKATSATFSGPNATTFTSVRFTFNASILPSSFTTADAIGLTGPGGSFAAAGVTAVAGSNATQFDVTFAAQTAAGTYSITVGPNIADASGRAMNQNANSINGEVPADRYTASASLADGRFAFSAGNLPAAIPDVSGVTVPIVVNRDIRIDDLNVILNVSHTYDSDLVITLTSPGGATRTLVNRRGGSGDNFTVTTLDDQALSALANGRAPFNGSFRPEQSLSVFNGTNARGTWTLTVSDVAPQDTGKVTAATLSFAGNPGGLRGLALALRDDEAIAPAPTVAAIVPAAVKYWTPVLHGVWIAADGPTVGKKADRQPFDWAAELELQMRRAAARRVAEFKPVALSER